MTRSRLAIYGWLALAGACLLSSVVVTTVAGREQPSIAAYDLMHQRLPIFIDGWRGRDLPLGNNEVLTATEKLLNYDDYIYRVYEKEGAEIFVYAMFWRQGSISVREIAGHTPDSCWVANGARILDDYKGAIEMPIPPPFNPSGEQRSYLFPRENRPVFVTWWHLWGDKVIDSNYKKKSVLTMVAEIRTWLWDRRGAEADQIFVRIHSFKPFPSIAGSAVVLDFAKLFPGITVAPLQLEKK